MSLKSAQKSEDAFLVQRTCGGDVEAFEKLVSKYQKAIFNVALYKSKNYFDAEDLTQDIFLAAYKALNTLKSAENFSSWLFGIAYNRCHKWFQREKTKVLKFEELKLRAARDERLARRRAAQVPPMGTGVAGSETDLPLSEFLGRLAPDIREVLKLKYLEGLSYQEIESRLGINSNRIDYLIRKGKQALRVRESREEKV